MKIGCHFWISQLFEDFVFKKASIPLGSGREPRIPQYIVMSCSTVNLLSVTTESILSENRLKKSQPVHKSNMKR